MQHQNKKLYIDFSKHNTKTFFNEHLVIVATIANHDRVTAPRQTESTFKKQTKSRLVLEQPLLMLIKLTFVPPRNCLNSPVCRRASVH